MDRLFSLSLHWVDFVLCCCFSFRYYHSSSLMFTNYSNHLFHPSSLLSSLIPSLLSSLPSSLPSSLHLLLPFFQSQNPLSAAAATSLSASFSKLLSSSLLLLSSFRCVTSASHRHCFHMFVRKSCLLILLAHCLGCLIDLKLVEQPS